MTSEDTQNLRKEMENAHDQLEDRLKEIGMEVDKIMDNLYKRLEKPEEESSQHTHTADVPTEDDAGCWVDVGVDFPNEAGPYMLSCVVNHQDIEEKFNTGGAWWNHATIVPGPMRGMLKKHDGSSNKPEGLHNDDWVIVSSHPHGNYSVLNAKEIEWFNVRYYQVLQLHYEK